MNTRSPRNPKTPVVSKRGGVSGRQTALSAAAGQGGLVWCAAYTSSSAWALSVRLKITFYRTYINTITSAPINYRNGYC